ncbi:MAG: hypothetical protein J7M16_01215 [Anaerolineae bacterium]|nr:hypothetical protein [Anaerolineae bacterium]
MKLLRKNISLSAVDVAEELGIGRATLFYRLKKLGISFEDLRTALMKEYEEKTAKKVKRREKKALPPKSYEEFLERGVVKEVVKTINTASISDRQRRRILRFWYRLCKDLELAPEEFKNGEDLRNRIVDWLNQKISKGYDRDSLVSSIQTLQKWLEVNLLPSSIEQSEYTGKFQTAELPLDVRNDIVRELLGLYKETRKKFYLECVKALAFLYYTGSRAESLTNLVVEMKIKVNNPEFLRAYNEQEFVVVKTSEKGKKGKKITWRKLIPASYADFIPQRFTAKELNKLREVLRGLLLKYLDRVNEDTRKYIVDAKKTLHLMRHTAAREFLRAFKFNRYLVAKLLGWKKESNLNVYGDYDLLSLIEVSAEEHKIEFISAEVYAEVLKCIKK